MSFYSVAPFIEANYPEYFGYQEYPVADCVCLRKVAEEWGVFSNFYATPIVLGGVTFKNAEQVFQLMKFKDPEVIQRIRGGITAGGKTCHEVKRTAKSYEKRFRRADWGTMILDALKFALMKKYEQCELFKAELARSRCKFIVEDQASFPKKQPDCWGVKPTADGRLFRGPNVLGRLLMELRDNGSLAYRLPDDALGFLDVIKNSVMSES